MCNKSCYSFKCSVARYINAAFCEAYLTINNLTFCAWQQKLPTLVTGRAPYTYGSDVEKVEVYAKKFAKLGYYAMLSHRETLKNIFC